ncbi:MAG: hypothetical protein R2852_05080 [Bacteroidia bacterium]
METLEQAFDQLEAVKKSLYHLADVYDNAIVYDSSLKSYST